MTSLQPMCIARSSWDRFNWKAYVVYNLTIESSQHTETVPTWVPYVTAHGALAVFPAGTRRFWSAGCRWVPDESRIIF